MRHSKETEETEHFGASQVAQLELSNFSWDISVREFEPLIGAYSNPLSSCLSALSPLYLSKINIKKETMYSRGCSVPLLCF